MPRGFQIKRPKPAGWKPAGPKKTTPAPAGKPKGFAAAQAAAQRAAQNRRDAAEQKARLLEQKRKNAIEKRNAQAASRQQAAITKRLQREKYTVKSQDTADTIAKKLGTTAQDIAKQSPSTGLKAGQVLSYDVPLLKQKAEAYKAGLPEADPYGRDVSGRAERMLEFSKSLTANMPSELQGSQWDADAAGAGEGYFESALLQPGIDPTTGEPVPPAPTPFIDIERWKDKAFRDQYQRAYATVQEANIERGLRVSSAKYTWQWLSDLWLNDNFEDRPELIDPFTFAQGNPEMQRKVMEELGYYLRDDGYLAKIEFLDEGYGMGAGYGGLGGLPGIGGDYVPLPGSSTYGGKKSGGRTRAQSGKLSAGYNARTHWRV